MFFFSISLAQISLIPGVKKKFIGAAHYPFLVSHANKIGVFMRCFRTRGCSFFLVDCICYLLKIFFQFCKSLITAISKPSSMVESIAHQRSAYTTVDGKRKVHSYAATDKSLVCSENISKNACSGFFTAHADYVCILPVGDIWHENCLFVRANRSIMVYDPNPTSNVITNTLVLLRQFGDNRNVVCYSNGAHNILNDNDICGALVMLEMFLAMSATPNIPFERYSNDPASVATKVLRPDDTATHHGPLMNHPDNEPGLPRNRNIPRNQMD